jgi:hypothetical protein
MKDDKMQTHKHVITSAALTAFVAAPWVAAQDATVTRMELTAQVSSRPALAPLDMRVSVQFDNAKAAQILQVLANAAGLTLDAPAAPLPPVSLTVTNVRLRTALDAICDNASCTWRLEAATIKVADVRGANRGTGATLPPLVSIALEDVPAPDVFRAIGAAIGVAVAIDGQVQGPPLTVKFTNARTTDALGFLCMNAGCTWELDGATRELRVRFKAP